MQPHRVPLGRVVAVKPLAAGLVPPTAMPLPGDAPRNLPLNLGRPAVPSIAAKARAPRVSFHPFGSPAARRKPRPAISH